MKKIEKEIIDLSTNSPRLTSFKEYIDKWINEYSEDDNDDGVYLVCVGYDKKYKHAIKFSLTTKKNPQHDIFNAINCGLGSLKDPMAIDIFNGMCEYLCNLIVEYPKIEKLFMDNINRMKQNKDNNE